MELRLPFGLQLTKSAKLEARAPVSGSGRGFMGTILEPFTNAWQRNIEYTPATVLNNSTLFRGINLIASDIGKLDLQLCEIKKGNIWLPTSNPAYDHIFRRPNHYQTFQQFIESWIQSKIISGNTYVLKDYDKRGVVSRLYVLDPNRVQVAISPIDGSIWYDLHRDDIAGLGVEVERVPADYIIHDRYNTFFHPLIGLSPIYAAGLAAHGGIAMAESFTRFIENGSQPGGLLTSPKSITKEAAKTLGESWKANFTGGNSGRVAVLGDDLKYTQLAASAVDSQLIEQMRWNAETICSTLGIPGYKLGVGSAPTHGNIASLELQYHGQCLHPYLKAVEDLLDEGMGLYPYRCKFDMGDLIRLDEPTLVDMLAKEIGAGYLSINEARAMRNLEPIDGCDVPMLQNQMWPAPMLANRNDDPGSVQQLNTNETEEDAELEATKALDIIKKGLLNV